MRFLLPVLIAALASANAVACRNAPSSDSASSTRFKVGVLLPLTGATQWGGLPAKVAAELAGREINAGHLAGAYQLDLVFADGTCEPRTAYAAADKLINQNRVQS